MVWTGGGCWFFFIVPMTVGLGAGVGSIGGGEIGAHVGAVAAGILLWFLGTYVNRDVLYLDPEGDEYLPPNRHTLYWVPVQYWGIAVVLGAIGSWIFGWEW